MNINPARRRVTRDFDLYNDPFADERELRMLDRFIAGVIIIIACLLLLATCTPAHAACYGPDSWCEQAREAEQRHRDIDRWSEETSRRSQESIRDFEASIERQRAQQRHEELINSIDANTATTRRRRY
jgi:hypothetical protein